LPVSGKNWQRIWQKVAIKKPLFYKGFLRIWQKLAKNLAKSGKESGKIWQKLPVFLPLFATFLPGSFVFFERKLSKNSKNPYFIRLF